ncbi:hypothetical protein DPMN_101679 [Dreissena polymorpha]|uniref:Diphthine--ammonia ligase n=1 Tax=Dreissena polymorpha TaxID=45954 RepID=A0A9D4R9C0_DREPO|nr:hypothetical protein DPMN_101679 [Dreissena polymorpha]
MKVVALISGGKDSCYNMMQCVAEGHEIVALANLKPVEKDEIDSYMYQSVGHNAIDLYAEAMGLPLYRREILGSSKVTGRDYHPTSDDEVEDLYELLKTVKSQLPVEGVAVGAILSNYQRVRVENVCQRLELTPLAFLWRRDQEELLDEMIRCKLKAILIKVAAMGLYPKKHLGKSLEDMQEYLQKKHAEFDLNVCGEGGEYESFTLDCPLFTKKIVLDEVETVMHSDDAFAPVGYLNIKRAHLQDKDKVGYLNIKRAHLQDKDKVGYLNIKRAHLQDKDKVGYLNIKRAHLQDKDKVGYLNIKRAHLQDKDKVGYLNIKRAHLQDKDKVGYLNIKRAHLQDKDKVGYLNIKRAHLQDKDKHVEGTQHSRIDELPMKTSRHLYSELFGDDSDRLEISTEHLDVQSPCLSAPLSGSLKPLIIVRDNIFPSPGKHIWISNLISFPGNGDNISSQTRTLMEKLREILANSEEHFSLSDLVCVHLYVGNMVDFAAINSVYKTYFGINPAARVCVQVPLPSNVGLMMDCYGSSNHADRDTMHVQGLSHWAPANIGPYSQCVKLGQRLHIAGQIGMVPANLSLIHGGIQSQARLSLRHVARVLKAMETSCCMDNIVSCVCYVTHEEYISVAKHELKRVTSERFQCSPVYVVVPMLPKGAMIEWQVLANIGTRDIQVQRHVMTDKQLECTAVAHVCSDENISLSAHVYVRDESDKTKTDVDAALEMARSCSNRVCPQVTQCANWTIFYPSHLFSYQQMFEASQKWWKGDPFFLVPVTRLEEENMIISLCA